MSFVLRIIYLLLPKYLVISIFIDVGAAIEYFHVPLLRDENGRRLAKRALSKSLRKLREEGFTPNDIREQFFDKSIKNLWSEES